MLQGVQSGHDVQGMCTDKKHKSYVQVIRRMYRSAKVRGKTFFTMFLKELVFI